MLLFTFFRGVFDAAIAWQRFLIVLFFVTSTIHGDDNDDADDDADDGEDDGDDGDDGDDDEEEEEGKKLFNSSLSCKALLWSSSSW